MERLVDQERQGGSRIQSLERQLALQEQLLTMESAGSFPQNRQLSDYSSASRLGSLSTRFRENFRKHFQARSLARRLGLKRDEQFEALGLGYCGARGAARSEQERKGFSKLGLLEPNGKELLAGCLTVPLYSTVGQLVGFWGCALNRSAERRTGHGLMATGPLREELVLVDGVVEALAAFGAGITNVQALELLTPGWLPGLHQAGVRKVWLAASQAEPAMIGELLRLGLEVWRVEVPEDRDSRVDLLEYGPSWKAALKRATRLERKSSKKR